MKSSAALEKRFAGFVLLLFVSNTSFSAQPGDEFWDPDFGVPGVDAGQIISVLAIGPDVYFGGGFRAIGDLTTPSIARWDGTNWRSLGAGVDGYVSGLAYCQDELYAAGGFASAGDVVSTNLAAWNGASWRNVPGLIYGTIFCLASDGTNLYVGGRFTSAGGIPANNIAKWDGEKWSTLGEGIIPVVEGGSPVGQVHALLVNGADVYVGGLFRNAGGVGATNIARWDGTNWHALGHGLRYFDGPGYENGAVRALALHKGFLYAGGSFRLAGDIRTDSIARWDGHAWSSVGSGVNDGLSVQVLTADQSGVYAAGPFERIGDISARWLAKWDGTNWVALGSGIGGGTGGILGMASTGTELYVGGTFTSAGDKASTNIALWHIPHSLRIAQTNDGVRISWSSTGSNYLLEARNTFPQGTWSNVPQQSVVTNSECVITQPISTENTYYRLRKP
jgi:trimeric autotransporter adhesin